jgi:DNA-binding CsgD family transcriptional regulator
LTIAILFLSYGVSGNTGKTQHPDSIAFLIQQEMSLMQAIAIGLLFGIAKGCQLFSWAQCSYAQERKISVRKIAVSFILAGVLFFIVLLDIVPKSIPMIALPLTASLSFMLAAPDFTQTERLPSGEFVRLSNNDLLFCTLIIGFVWGALPHGIMNFSTIDTALSGLLAGLIILFFAALLKEGLDLEVTLLLAAVIICLSILTSLFLSSLAEFSAITVSTCFQISFLIVLANSSARGIANPGQSIAIVCRDIARFLFSIFVGLLLGLLLNALVYVCLAINVLLLMAIIVIVFRGRRRILVSIQATDDTKSPFSSSPSANTVTIVDLDTRCKELAEARSLTRRETDVLILLSRGHNMNHIANTLYLSINTVKKHRNSLYMKLNVHKRQDLINLLNE